MELYTSLVRLKQAMNGGALPPMMPIQGALLKLVDPAFAIGMGGLFEDAERGLRCPVRGCGRFFHRIAQHLSMAHPTIGGADGLRLALGIPRRTALISQRERERIALSMLADPARRERAIARLREVNGRVKRGERISGGAKGQAQAVLARLSANAQNLRDQCERQVSHKLVALETKLGRAPTGAEAEQEYDSAFVRRIREVFGSWENAVGQLGLRRIRTGRAGGLTREACLEALRVWHLEHGDFPTRNDASRRSARPLLPSPKPILRALGTADWWSAMRRAASALDIYGGRYGLPEKRSA